MLGLVDQPVACGCSSSTRRCERRAAGWTASSPSASTSRPRVRAAPAGRAESTGADGDAYAAAVSHSRQWPAATSRRTLRGRDESAVRRRSSNCHQPATSVAAMRAMGLLTVLLLHCRGRRLRQREGNDHPGSAGAEAARGLRGRQSDRDSPSAAAALSPSGRDRGATGTRDPASRHPRAARARPGQASAREKSELRGAARRAAADDDRAAPRPPGAPQRLRGDRAIHAPRSGRPQGPTTSARRRDCQVAARSTPSQSQAARSSAGAIPSAGSSAGRQEAARRAASASTSRRSAPSLRATARISSTCTVAASRSCDTLSSRGIRCSRGSASPRGRTSAG